MKFLVTGGRGFIGSHFVELCLSKGHKVIDVDKMTYASNQKLSWDDDENYTLIKEDIGNLTHLPLCDIIVNFAAESHVDNSINEPDVFAQSNILGTQNLLNLLRGKVYERPLFVHISTDEVYGDIEDGHMTEASCLNPSNPYSASKAAAEMILLSYGRTYGIDYQICRSSNNYGSRQYPEKLIPKIVQCLSEDRPIPLHGDGSYIRDWTYVKDNVEGIYKVCFSKQKNEIWNISADNCLSNIEIVDQVSSWMSKNPDIKFVENRLGQDMRYSISSEKIRRELNWKPQKQTLYNFL
jgi:dTDP-glucose 4,6-dehydratase|tara:strand:+ start:252 stop:1136 length:885 start_codon:yes stop_codon:yes gene_type:complete